MAKENLKMLAAVAITAILACTGTYAVAGNHGGSSHNLIETRLPSLSLGTYAVNELFDSGAALDSEISGFGSFGEFREFVDRLPESGGYDYYDGAENSLADDAPAASGSGGETYRTETNIQVAGVDEGDIVKNDGECAYIISGSGESVFIVRAYPTDEAGILSEITSEGTFVDIYIDGESLITVEQAYYFEGGFGRSSHMHSTTPVLTLKVFDISDRTSPALSREAALAGNYQTSRLIDGKLYVIGSVGMQDWENESQLPMPLESLYHLDNGEGAHTITSFMAADIHDNDAAPSVMGIAMSCSNNIYVSNRNIYITHIKSRTGQIYENEYSETTVIHRIGIQGQGLKYKVRGEVSGRALNRYSMDEFDGHFRIATTKGWSWGSEQSKNMVHVLDMALEPTGKLDDIAPGEQIYSARFMGTRLYLVTFRQVDPFYVIDLHDAENPKILGELKIPGYSSYLHPYDDNHIIGLGKDGSLVKLALFNVTDVTKPTELDSVTIGNGYSDSLALGDPHAFMFSPEKNLLVIPVNGYDYHSGRSYSAAHVFDVSPEGGIVLEGTVEHGTNAQDSEYYNRYYSCNQVKRSFAIGNVLYTVSDEMMKANGIGGLALKATVNLCSAP